VNKRVLIAIADGSEEVEITSVVDVLRRAGALVTIASVDEQEVTLSRGMRLVADQLIRDCQQEEYDLIVLPGGMPGTEHLRDCDLLIDMLKAQKQSGRLIAAICAAPVLVLHYYGLLENIKATCYPSLADELPHQEAVEFNVVVDQNFITSRSPGTALHFAIKLVELLFDLERASQISKAMLID
jgi:4-methyl-5(b-hydroxyethyl)-thiazole monophosphate biosynthesis